MHITERTRQHLDGVFRVTPHLANTFLVEEAGQDAASLAVPSHAHMVHHRSQPHSSMTPYYGINLRAMTTDQV